MAKKPVRGNPKVAVGYVRVSTERQHEGPEVQRRALTEWAEREGVTLVAVFQDSGVSGASEISERPALLAALSSLRSFDAGVLLIKCRDRIARDVVVAGLADRAASSAGASVVCSDGAGNGSSPSDVFMRTVLDSAAQYERALIRSRTRDALASKRARGERVGGVPYGFALGSSVLSKSSGSPCALTPVESEQSVVSRMRELHRSGKGAWAISRQLNREGLTTRSGKPWTQIQVQRVLDSSLTSPGASPSP